MTPERFLEMVREQDPGARETERITEGYFEAVITLSDGGCLVYLIDYEGSEPMDLVIQAQDPDANSTNSFELDDPNDETEMRQVITDGIEWAKPWTEE